MVLNPNGIEPTFLKLGFVVAGGSFYSIITSNILNYIKKKKQFYADNSTFRHRFGANCVSIVYLSSMF